MALFYSQGDGDTVDAEEEQQQGEHQQQKQQHQQQEETTNTTQASLLPLLVGKLRYRSGIMFSIYPK